MALPQSPVVEMLWESRDPHRALTERFGFPDGMSAARWLAATLDECWGIETVSCERIMLTDRAALGWVSTRSGRLLAKWSVASERFPRLEQSAYLTHWLDGRGVPVSAPLPALDGRLQVEADGASLGVQHEIAGDLLDISRPEQVFAAGAALARLQDALATYPDAHRVAALRCGASEPLTARITEWLDADAGHLPARARDALRKLVAQAPPDPLPLQLVHYDFRSANILCAGDRIAAVIDFDEARIDHRIVELARAAVLLGTRFRNWAPIEPEVRARFLAGYRSVRRLTPVEEGWWHPVLLWHALAMVPSGDDPTGWATAALNQLVRPDAIRDIAG